MMINDGVIGDMSIARISAIAGEGESRLSHLPPGYVVSLKMLGGNAYHSMSSVAHWLRTLWTTAKAMIGMVLSVRSKLKWLTVEVVAIGNHI